MLDEPDAEPTLPEALDERRHLTTSGAGRWPHSVLAVAPPGQPAQTGRAEQQPADDFGADLTPGLRAQQERLRAQVAARQPS